VSVITGAGRTFAQFSWKEKNCVSRYLPEIKPLKPIKQAL